MGHPTEGERFRTQVVEADPGGCRRRVKKTEEGLNRRGNALGGKKRRSRERLIGKRFRRKDYMAGGW